MSPCRYDSATNAASLVSSHADLSALQNQAAARRDLGLTSGERARNLAIILGSIAAFAILIYLLRLSLPRRHVESHEQESDHPNANRTPNPAHINPAQFMRICALREQRMQGSPRRLLKHDEIDGVAPSSTWLPTSTMPGTGANLGDRAIERPAAVELRSSRLHGGFEVHENTQPIIDTCQKEQSCAGSVKSMEMVMEEPSTLPQTRCVSSSEEAAVDTPTCWICLEAIQSNQKVRSTLCCHVFHKNCLERWLTMYRGRCPLCQKWLKPGGAA